MPFLNRLKKQPATQAEEEQPALEIPNPRDNAVPTLHVGRVEPGAEDQRAEETSAVAGFSAEDAARFLPVPEERFSLEDTSRIAELYEIPRERRDYAWLTAFQQAAWNASIVLPQQPVFLGPDGMPYIRLELPPPGEEVQTNCLSNLYVSLAAQGLGAAFFRTATDPPEAAEYVAPTGILESLRAFGTWDGDPADTAEMVARAEADVARSDDRNGDSAAGTEPKERQVMVGTPAESYLPRHTAQLLYRHLTEGWRMEDPRIALVVDAESAPSRSLVISRKFSEFPDAETASRSTQMLLWYLPPRRYLLLMPEEWTPEQMKPLKELC